jgi:hypothetical protein
MSLSMTAVAHAQATGGADAHEQFRQGERASQDQGGTADAEELFRRGERASQERAMDEMAPPEPSEQPNRIPAALGVLAGALAVFGGLTLLATRRTRVRIRPHQAA